APARHAGEPAYARADRFGLCVAVHEAVYGERPCEGRTVQGSLLASAEGRIRPPLARSKVPGWLRRVVIRGLAHDPAKRWPSMDALIDAIDRESSKRRRRPIAGLA